MELSRIQYSIIQFFVICLIFYIEALIHYNIGKFGHVAFNLPSFRQNLLIIGIIMFFSFISSCIIYFLEKILIAL